ncbi:uncharacterized protein LOC141538749 [Sminthopsis crassicaudata]|uniref:uncharacterized protein LOC141538749 n=1 Tax=Sminthopsis crassicaudata TaxID=9301 RepID=UPI003D690844
MLLRTSGILCLLVALSATGNSKFAEFRCKKEVSACQNDRVEINCTSTMDFREIGLYLCKNENDRGELLFNRTTVGEYPLQKGMRVMFENREVKLVIEKTQISHQGLYRWRLLSKGSIIKFTRLYVSESPIISKENDKLICQATLEKPGRRIIWSNETDWTEKTEFISNQDARGLFNLSSIKLWKDSFNSNPPCCKVVDDERGSPEFCAQTCYTNAMMSKSLGEVWKNGSVRVNNFLSFFVLFGIKIAILMYLE